MLTPKTAMAGRRSIAPPVATTSPWSSFWWSTARAFSPPPSATTRRPPRSARRTRRASTDAPSTFTVSLEQFERISSSKKVKVVFFVGVQEKLGILSGGVVYAVFDYAAQQPDELSFEAGQQLTVLRKGDESEREWWWSRLSDKEGYVPRNLLGVSVTILVKSNGFNTAVFLVNICNRKENNL